jgi:hypothetical protein
MELPIVFLIVAFVEGYCLREAISQFRRAQARQERRIAHYNVASGSFSPTSIAPLRITDLVWAIAPKPRHSAQFAADGWRGWLLE